MFPKQQPVSAELECKSVYLAALMSACVFVDCVRGCPPDCVYMSKFCMLSGEVDEVGGVLGAVGWFW